MNDKTAHPSWQYAVLILLQSLVYGFGNPLTKIAYESITPLWLLTIRFTIAFLIFMLIFHRRILASLKFEHLRALLPASLCMAGAYITCNIALDMTTATKVGFMMSLSVILAPVLSTLILKRKYKLQLLPVQLFVLAGVFLLYYDGTKLTFNRGDAVSLVMSFFLAASLVFGEIALLKTDAITVSAYQCALTAIISLILALLFDDVSVLAGVRTPAVLIVLYLAVFCSCIAYFFQNKALMHLKSGSVSMLQCTQPILTAVVSFFMIGEEMGLAMLMGGTMIILGILLETVITKQE